MATKKQESGLPVGMTEKEFFSTPNLISKQARIFVKIEKENGLDANGKIIETQPEKIVEAAPGYWGVWDENIKQYRGGILRHYGKDVEPEDWGKPQLPQELVSYSLLEDGVRKEYLFKQ